MPAGLEPYSFKFGEYVFVYQRLIVTSDDHKDATTAEVGIYMDGKKLSTVYPAKWDFHRGGEQATTEVAITVRMSEDVYVVLTGYEQDSGLANFRVFINPLISWVWLGFLDPVRVWRRSVCLLPASLAHVRDRTPADARGLGRAADTGTRDGDRDRRDARDREPGARGAVAAGERARGAPAAGRHGHGRDRRRLCRAEPADEPGGGSRDEGSPVHVQLLAPHDLRVRLRHRRRAARADQRGWSPSPTTGRRLTSAKLAYDDVLAQFIHKYGGEQVLASPRSSFSWAVPMVAVIGGLGLLFVVGRRWVAVAARPRRSRRGTSATAWSTRTTRTSSTTSCETWSNRRVDDG